MHFYSLKVMVRNKALTGTIDMASEPFLNCINMPADEILSGFFLYVDTGSKLYNGKEAQVISLYTAVAQAVECFLRSLDTITVK